MKNKTPILISSAMALALYGCASVELPSSKLISPAVDEQGQYVYRIGTGDIVSVFVWGNDDISGDYGVRPDGRISMALTDAVVATGLTTAKLERKLQVKLAEFIKAPKVTIMIKSAAGNMVEQVKVVGEAAQPAAFPYSKGMTLLDLMIRIGGLSPFADGNDAILIRIVDGNAVEYPVRAEDLMEDADLSANVDLMPGDVLRIPEAWF